MVGRAERITGPYVAERGAPMMSGATRQILAGSGRYRGPGGQSIFVDGRTYWLVYHYYDVDDGGVSKLEIRRLGWTKDGWPYAAGPLEVAPQ